MGWINVNERLPESGSHVWCYCEADIRIKKNPTWQYITLLFKDGEFMTSFKVTYWMPLPQEPVIVCSVCDEPILPDHDESCQCDACEAIVHVDCGGKGSVVGVETWGCNNCHKMD